MVRRPRWQSGWKKPVEQCRNLAQAAYDLWQAKQHSDAIKVKRYLTRNVRH
jgi:hypothetical protein